MIVKKKSEQSSQRDDRDVCCVQFPSDVTVIHYNAMQMHVLWIDDKEGAHMRLMSDTHLSTTVKAFSLICLNFKSTQPYSGRIVNKA